MVTNKDKSGNRLSDNQITIFTNQIDTGHKEALKAMNSLIKDYPNCHRAHTVMAFLQDKESDETGNYDKGLYYINKSKDLGCGDDIYYKSLKHHFRKAGFYYISKGSFEEALEYYLESLNGNLSDNALHLCDVGNCLDKLNRSDEARVYFNKALNLNKSYAPAYYYLALSFYFSDDFDLAIKNYQLAYNIDSSNTQLLIDFGNCLFKMKEYDRAIKLYYETRMLEPSNENVYQVLCVALVKLERYDEIFKLLNSELNIVANNNVLLHYYKDSKTRLGVNDD